jgi:hypothetical protein
MNLPTDAQRLEMILALEGMPAELPLLVDSPDYFSQRQDEQEYDSAHAEIQSALSLDELTPVDTFFAAQQPSEYRWKDNEDN